MKSYNFKTLSVIPGLIGDPVEKWIPAFVGMTNKAKDV